MLNIGKFYGAGIEPPLGGFLNNGKTVHVLIDAMVLAAEAAVPASYYQIANSQLPPFLRGACPACFGGGVFNCIAKRRHRFSPWRCRDPRVSAVRPRTVPGAQRRWVTLEEGDPKTLRRLLRHVH
jgi:hypothetical protein